jgi:hypothetical protein
MAVVILALCSCGREKTEGTSGTRQATSYLQIQSQAVTSFTLLNTTITTVVAGSPVTGYDPIVEGAVIDLAQTGSNLSIRANTTPTIVGSVALSMDGTYSRTENNWPYTLCGDDQNGTIQNCNFTPGAHTLTATPYSSSNLSGLTGKPLTLTFTVTGPTDAGVGAETDAGSAADGGGQGAGPEDAGPHSEGPGPGAVLTPAMQTIDAGSLVIVDGTHSLRRGHAPQSYQWAESMGPTGIYLAQGASTQQLILGVPGDYVFTLTAQFDDGASSQASATVRVLGSGMPPPSQSMGCQAIPLAWLLSLGLLLPLLRIYRAR